jgi:glutaredoxin-like YruB-family protein
MAVTVYSTPTCPYCNMAKQYFKEKGIEFVDYNVAENPEKAEEMIKKSGQQGVPVIDINGKIIVGFNKAEIDKALGL